MTCVIVPNTLRDAIYGRIDAELLKWPGAIGDREYFYNQLLCYFNEHGEIPEFDLVKKDTPA